MNTATVLQNLHFTVQNVCKLHNMLRASRYALAIALGLCMAALALSLFSPDSAEVAVSVVKQAGLLCLLCLLGLAGVAFAGHMAEGVREIAAYVPPQDETKALPSGTFDISPDVLVYRMPGEGKQDYIARAKAAIAAATPSAWVVWPDFTENVLTIATGPESATLCDMGEEPWSEELPERFRIPEGAEIVPEKYIAWLRGIFPEWAAGMRKQAEKERRERRIKSIETPLEIVEFVRTSAVCILMLFSVGMFAQSKTRQVDESVGTRIREIPSAGSRVEYTFREGRREKTYIATGTGHTDYTDLLRSTGTGLARYNDEGGTLLFVKKDGEVIAKGTAVGDVATRVKYEFEPSTTGDPVRPRRLPNEQPTYTGEPQSFSLPDSMAMVENIENMKEEITGWKARLWASARPVWDFFMWIFGSLFFLLIGLLGMLHYIAGSAANESLVSTYGHVIVGRWIVSVQQNSAAMCLVTAWCIVGTLMVNSFLWLIWLDVPAWAVCLVWLIEVWVSTRLTDWLVPNLKVANNTNRGLQTY